MFETKMFNEISYVMVKPKDFAETDKYPTIIFMHGAGTRGNDIEKLKTNPFFNLSIPHIENCITFAPHCNSDTWFDIFEQVLDFCKFVSEHRNTDRSRIYLIGASMGAYAVWQMAMSKPELFAAIVPICGGGMYWNSSRLKNIPIWAFHGKDDTCVSVNESIKMVNCINENGGNAKLTIYENTGHDAWSETYKNETVFKWLFSNVKRSEHTEYTNFYDSKTHG